MRADTSGLGYYVGILFTREGCDRFTVDISFVTRIDYGPKTFEYKSIESIVETDDLRPVVLDHDRARDFIFGLMWNGYAPILVPEICFPALNPKERARMRENADKKEVSE